jgi:hypothetical protein
MVLLAEGLCCVKKGVSVVIIAAFLIWGCINTLAFCYPLAALGRFNQRDRILAVVE